MAEFFNACFLFSRAGNEPKMFPTFINVTKAFTLQHEQAFEIAENVREIKLILHNDSTVSH